MADESLGASKRPVLNGDGTWPFQAVIDGEDILVKDIVITCFGGWGRGNIADPQDNGRTASGRNTKNEAIEGVSVAMNSVYFPEMKAKDPAGYKALLGSPLPRMDWGTKVEVTINGQTFTPKDGIVDLGPGKGATKNKAEPHALDLTPLAAALFAPNTPLRRLALDFEERGSYRIIDGAKFVNT
jgi:hypothetical protein